MAWIFFQEAPKVVPSLSSFLCDWCLAATIIIRPLDYVLELTSWIAGLGSTQEREVSTDTPCPSSPREKPNWPSRKLSFSCLPCLLLLNFFSAAPCTSIMGCCQEMLSPERGVGRCVFSSPASIPILASATGFLTKATLPQAQSLWSVWLFHLHLQMRLVTQIWPVDRSSG